ncbi:unnamed protein product, partial [marine sediment metagenome]
MNLQFTNFQTKQESIKITSFIKSTLKKQGFEKVIIPVSGGLDSSTCLLLCVKALVPEKVIAVKLPSAKQNMKLADLVIRQAGIPKKNVFEINIGKAVNQVVRSLGNKVNSLRKGNIMARVRMIITYDLAKKHAALVCGAENKSEYLLGYYTRFGDEACDLSPIKHLYKTQVYQLAEYLDVPKEIINQPPSAGFWPGQTDEKEFGFTYKQADQILYLYFEKGLNKKEIHRRIQRRLKSANTKTLNFANTKT